MSLKPHELPPAPGVPIKNAVIFLHGYGDNGSGGLLDIGRLWQTTLPQTLFLCPDAPMPLEGAPPSFEGRQWFALQSLSKAELGAGVRSASAALNNYIDEVMDAHTLRSDQVALVGFSQGTMMALHVGVRRTEPLAAIVGYSGLLADGEGLRAEVKSRPPVLLVHGTDDERVPFQSMAAAASALSAVGIPVRTLPCPHLGHSIDNLGVRAGMDFLRAHLSEPSAKP